MTASRFFIIAAVVGIMLAGCKKDITLSSIAVTKQPDKKEYFLGEAFSHTGMVVTARYSDKSEKPVTVTDNMISYTFSVGDKNSVIITYNGKTATVEGIKVNPVLQSIAVTKQPTKKEYVVDEQFDPAGMEVTATYNDNSKLIVPLTDLDFDYNFSTTGDNKTVTITRKSTAIFTEVTGISLVYSKSNYFSKWNKSNGALITISENLYREDGPGQGNWLEITISAWTEVTNENPETKDDYPSGYKVEGTISGGAPARANVSYFYLHKDDKNSIADQYIHNNIWFLAQLSRVIE
jgi:hypothetical protein